MHLVDDIHPFFCFRRQELYLITQTTNVIDTVGYTNDERLSTSNGLPKGDGSGAGYCITGFIPVSSKDDVIRAKGVDFNYPTQQYACFGIYTKAEEVADALQTATYTKNTNNGESYLRMDIGEDGSITLFQLNDSFPYAGVCYIRLCGYGNGENLIVTINEPIASC